MDHRRRATASWGWVRVALVSFAAVALVPGAVLTLLALAFVLTPAALAGLPFIVPALFRGAASAHVANTTRARSIALHGAHAMA